MGERKGLATKRAFHPAKHPQRPYRWSLLALIVGSLNASIVEGVPLKRAPPTRSVSSSSPGYTVCDSDACKSTGEEIAAQLYGEKSVCSDFYKYVCGGWHLKHKVPRGEQWWDQVSIAEQNARNVLKAVLNGQDEPGEPEERASMVAARDFHRECMDQEKIEREGMATLRALLNALGGWPIARPLHRQPEGADLSLSWSEVEREATKLTGRSSFFQFGVTISHGEYVLTLEPGELMLTAEQLLSPDQQFARSSYREMIGDAALAVAAGEPSNRFKKAMSEQISEMLQFEIELAKIVTSKGNGSSLATTVGDLQKLYEGKLGLTVTGDTEYAGACLLLLSRRSIPRSYAAVRRNKCAFQLNWPQQIRRALGLDDNDILQDHFPIVVSNIDYFVKLCRLFEKTPDRAIANFIHWNIVRSLLPRVDATTKSIYEAASRKLKLDVQQFPSRWHECLEANAFKDSVYYEALKKQFPPSVDDKVLDIFSAVELEVVKGFKSAAHIQGNVERNALRAIDEINLRYKAPESYANVKIVDSTPLETAAGPNYLEQVLAHMRYNARRNILKTYQTPDPNSGMQLWDGDVSVRFSDNATILNIPAGSLMLPFFHVDLPDAYLFGSVGTRLAQSLSEIANLQIHSDFFATAERPTEAARVRCFTNQTFGNYRSESDGARAHGSNGAADWPPDYSWSHKIQDALGLDVGYKAYRAWVRATREKPVRLAGLENFTNDQLFFVAYANRYCEAPTTFQTTTFARWSSGHQPRGYANSDMVNMAVMNSEHFANAFNCPTGSPMNPARKCSYWQQQPSDVVGRRRKGRARSVDQSTDDDQWLSRPPPHTKLTSPPLVGSLELGVTDRCSERANSTSDHPC